MSIASSDIRNVAIIGHGGTGKTSLMELALVRGGEVPKFAPVDAGKSVSDRTEEEIARGISIHTALGHLEWNGAKVNLLDTPGSADFIGEAVAALHVAETAIVTVGADVGVQIETAKLWRRLEAAAKPRIVFVNQMDKEHASFADTLADLRAKLPGTFVPVAVPIGAGAGFSGVVDLLRGTALVQDDGREAAADVPSELADEVEQYRQDLIEGAAEGDDVLMEKYLDEETLSDEEIRTGLAIALRSGAVVPVVAGAVTAGAGVTSVLDLVQLAAPAPDASAADAADGPEAFVFKTSLDQYSGKLSWIRMMQGTLKPDTELTNQRDRKKERISKVYLLQGGKLTETPALATGDVGVLTKLSTAATGDTLAQGSDVSYPPLDLPQPVHAVTVAAASKKDDDKLGQFLARAGEEDPTFKVAYNGETRENVASCMGELQLTVVLDKIKRAAKIEVETKVPRVGYRETIAGSAAAEYQHKKQTGGHGQYAKVEIKVKPVPRGGEEFQFVNQIFGGAISRGYIPGVEKGLREGMTSGVLAGYPVMGIEVTLVDGREHSVDSSELAFSLAARGALRDALGKARPVLLEPISNLTVSVEEHYLGDVLSDLSGRRGRIQGQEPIGGGMLEVKALVPQAELLRYAIDLKSMTSGTGSFEVEFAEYAPVTGRLADDVIKRSQAAAAAAGR